MHLPDHIISSEVSITTGVISIIGIIISTIVISKDSKKPKTEMLVLTSMIIFIAQMLNFKVSGGTSGHFLGSALSTFLFGAPYSIIIMSTILTIQALIFADGGLSVLGANIFIMSIIPSILVGFLKDIFLKKIDKKYLMFILSWISVILAAFVCSVLVSISNLVDSVKFILSMVSVHSVIGIGEGLITTLLYSILNLKLKKVENKKNKLYYISALTIMLLLTPFASTRPDGLEWAIEKFKLIHEKGPVFTGALIPDYILKLPNVNEVFGVYLAAIIGTIIISIATFLIFKFILKLKLN